MKIVRVQIGRKIFRVKDCKGLSSVKGLMFDDMKDYDGALIYANNIWMPFVKRRLNLVFLDKNMRVIEQKMAVPLSADRSSWKVYSTSKAKYCLELKDMKVRLAKGTRIKML